MSAENDPDAFEAATTLVRMTVSEVNVDPLTGMPALILRDEYGGSRVSINMALGEATAITTVLNEIRLERPLPHDLLKEVVSLSGMEFVQAEVRVLPGGIHHGTIVLRHGDGTLHRLDARPSDAIALALRMGGKVLIASEILISSALPAGCRATPARRQKWKM